MGERIARERDRQRITLSAFSRRVTREAGGARGTSRTAIRNLEEGRVDSPSKDVVEAIARVLGVREAWLWDGEPPRFSHGSAAAATPDEAAPVDSTAPPPRRRPLARRTWMESPPSPPRAAYAWEPAPSDEPSHVDVPEVPEAHPVWGPGVARTIATGSLLARASRPVRTRFWSVLRAAADHPGSGVTGPDDILRLARQLDDLVLRPMELLRPGVEPDGLRFEGYALSLLESVESLLEGGEGTVLRPVAQTGAAPFRQPAVPPSISQPRTMERREREGLTWRLM